MTVLEGQGQAALDGCIEPLRVGTMLHCQAKESFTVQNTGSSRLSLLVFLYPGNPRFGSNVRRRAEALRLRSSRVLRLGRALSAERINDRMDN